ncbi:hypothetical protein GQ457_16G015460 [Hibiscus cannabinus]
MAFFFWNVHGLGKKVTTISFKFLVSEFQPNTVFLSETKQKKPFLEKIESISQGWEVKQSANGVFWEILISDTFPKAIGLLEATIGSDHSPIILLLSDIKRERETSNLSLGGL